MNDLDSKYTRKKILRNLIAYVFLFIFLYISWIFIHEMSHIFVCDSYGYSGTMNYALKDSASVICPSIDENPINNIVFALAPYLFDLVVIVGVFRLRFSKTLSSFHSILLILPYIISLEIVQNYVSTLFTQTDFLILLQIFKANWNIPYVVIFGMFSFILVWVALIISLYLIKLNLKIIYLKIMEYRNSFQKTR